MQPEKSLIKVSIGTVEFTFATVAEAVALLRGIEHASPRRRRAKPVTPKQENKAHA